MYLNNVVNIKIEQTKFDENYVVKRKNSTEKYGG